MLGKPLTPIEEIKAKIASLDLAADRAQEEADAAQQRVEDEISLVNACKSAAMGWRKILAREESGTRTVTVKLGADVAGFIAGMESAGEAARKAGLAIRPHTCCQVGNVID